MKTLAIANNKGGIGKSTICSILNDCLKHKGYKTLFIDVDQQCNSTFCFDVSSEGVCSIYDVFKKECTVKEAIIHTEYGDIVPGDELISGIEFELMSNIGGTNILKKALKEVEDEYDFCIIDTPPNLGIFLINALVAADYAIIPVRADTFSISGLSKVLNAINEIVENLNENLKVAGVVLSSYDARTELDRSLKLELNTSDIGVPVFKTAIRVCQDIKKAQDMQVSIFDKFPNSKAVQDYTYFTEELLKRIGE